MSRQLISTHNINDFIHDNCLTLTKNMLLSPGADDYAKKQGIQVIRYTRANAGQHLPHRISTLLEKEFNITDPAIINAVEQKIISLLNITR